MYQCTNVLMVAFAQIVTKEEKGCAHVSRARSGTTKLQTEPLPVNFRSSPEHNSSFFEEVDNKVDNVAIRLPLVYPKRELTFVIKGVEAD